MNVSQSDTFHGSFTSVLKIASWVIVATLTLAGIMSPTPLRAASDEATGKQIYDVHCLGCHGDEKTTGTIGPSLIGIVGRKAATGESGVHSRALMEADITWNEVLLRKFLAAPSRQVPGTIMPVGVSDPQQLDDLLAYLRTLR